ncbi:MAG: flavin reductase family protein [Sulfitobacter sp.]
MTVDDPRALRHAFGSFMTGVTVVTTHAPDGTPLGFTANSFTSVSLDPPLLLVCLAKSSSNYAAFCAANGFAVNVLAETQIEISNTFARPVDDRFAAVKWRAGPQGAPVLEGVSAWFDCTMHRTVDAGDHMILIGEVKAFDANAAPGLGYAQGAYVTPATEAKALTARTDLVVSALIEREGAVLLLDDGQGGLMLPEMQVEKDSVSVAIQKLIAATGLRAQPGFVYSVFEDTARQRQHISFLCQTAEGAPTRGTFVPLRGSALDDVSDPAILTLLERFRDESAFGHFGIYYGNQISGEVRAVLPKE